MAAALYAFLLAGTAGAVSWGDAADKCARLASALQFPNSSVILTEYRADKPVLDLSGLVPSCAVTLTSTIKTTADLCRVVLSVNTTATSSVLVEGWLPDTWNHRLMATGGGGTGGCVDYLSMMYGTSLGFASFGTNGGHNGSTGTDLFLDKPEVINDFGHRAVHVEAEVAKYTVDQYYGSPANYNYYVGCSTGGRQGIKEAALYPDDFDGILAGVPGVHWFSLISTYILLMKRTGWPDIHSPGYVRAEQWDAIVRAQIELLDALDGVEDGIIDQPYLHEFDPVILGCGGGILNDTVCLSPQQIATVRDMYQPILNSTGQLAMPAWELGAPTNLWSDNIVNGSAYIGPGLTDIFASIIYSNPNWSVDSFSITDLEFAARTDPGGTETTETDLSAFHQKGGKLLSFHGGYDQFAPSGLSRWYYTSVGATLNISIEELQSFYRLVYVNGMNHCLGGPGAWDIGQIVGQTGPSSSGLNSTDYNVLLALVDWTENGNAPDSVIGTLAEEGKVLSQRRHCVYPKISTWDGKGSPDEAPSWYCA